ncbi:MAG TPA: lasso peptide biosynthesis B2 protein [Fibrobacteria bacterium]|nr:lasso peptide biosynthesis B2 protein [Fibrobacteria bacterium]
MMDWRRIDSVHPELRFAAACSYLPANGSGGWENCRTVLDRAVQEGGTPEDFLGLFKRHRIQALAAEVLRRSDRLWIMGDQQDALLGMEREIRLRALRLGMLEQRLIRDFGAAGIECLSMKGGPGLSRKLYGDMGLRQCKDIDLVVRPEAFFDAVRKLETWGWEAAQPVWTRDAGHRWLCRRLMRDLVFLHPGDGAVLELHFRFERAWEPRREEIWWREYRQAPTGSLGDAEFLYLCLHGAEHSWLRMKWLGDLQAHLERVPDAFDRCRDLAGELSLVALTDSVRALLGLLYGGEDGFPVERVALEQVRISLRALSHPEFSEMDPWEVKAIALEERSSRDRFLGARNDQARSIGNRLLSAWVRAGDVVGVGGMPGWFLVLPFARPASLVYRYGVLGGRRIADRVRRKLSRIVFLAEVGGALGAAWALKRLVPFSRLSAVLGKPTGVPESPSAVPAPVLRAFAWGFEVWHRRWPWPAVCLTEVLALRLMMNRRGIEATAVFGVRSSGTKVGIDAHAWMLCGGRILPREQDVSGYRVVSTFHR